MRRARRPFCSAPLVISLTSSTISYARREAWSGKSQHNGVTVAQLTIRVPFRLHLLSQLKEEHVAVQVRTRQRKRVDFVAEVQRLTLQMARRNEKVNFVDSSLLGEEELEKRTNIKLPHSSTFSLSPSPPSLASLLLSLSSSSPTVKAPVALFTLSTHLLQLPSPACAARPSSIKRATTLRPIWSRATRRE